jgi:hypothetical protein
VQEDYDEGIIVNEEQYRYPICGLDDFDISHYPPDPMINDLDDDFSL